jgi:hypothetical protein
MKDNLGLILDALRTPSPFGEDGPNEMETLAIAAHDPGTKFKHVVVNMRGVNGNTMVILGVVKRALKSAGATPMELSLFLGNAMSGDYEHALATVVKWVTVSDKENQPRRDAWDAFVRCAEKESE